MALCGYSKDAALLDATPIENLFLLEYMPGAPEGCVRVYLYLRMVCAHPELGGELGDVARALRMDEDEVLDALRYWEQQRLVEKLSDRPPRFELKPVQSSSPVEAYDDEAYDVLALHSALRALFREEDAPQHRHLRRASDWVEDLGYSREAAVKLVEYELRLPGGHKPEAVFKRADRRAIEWAEQGIHSLAEVEEAIAREDRAREMARVVLERFSLSRQPTLDELNCARRWIEEWHLTAEDVRDACAETTKAQNPSFSYLNSILQNRVQGGTDAYFGSVKALLKELGVRAAPTPSQLQAYSGFLARGFAPETIRYAAERCARRNRGSFEKLEQTLDAWAEAGAFTRAEAERYEAEAQRRRSSRTPAQPQAADPMNYQQHRYSKADFGDDFYYDPGRDVPEGGGGK